MGQDSANDDNANEKYPTLDGAIRATYAARSTATNKNSLYDSYIRAIKWATLRLGDRGIVAFVTNGGFLDSNTADGMRQALAEDFAAIHVFNLRGNRRQGGAEGRPIWEAFAKGSGGSIATIAIVVLVKRPLTAGPATIYYSQVGDFTTATEKVAEVVAAGSIGGLVPLHITPNAHGDWLTQRADDFGNFIAIESIFLIATRGVETARDSWVYNFSHSAVSANAVRMIETYEHERSRLGADPNYILSADTTEISRSRSLRNDAARGRSIEHDPRRIILATYRPFTRMNLYFDRALNNVVGQSPLLFPSATATNRGFYQVGAGSAVPFSIVALDGVPDLHVTGAGSGGNSLRGGGTRRSTTQGCSRSTRVR